MADDDLVIYFVTKGDSSVGINSESAILNLEGVKNWLPDVPEAEHFLRETLAPTLAELLQTFYDDKVDVHFADDLPSD